MSDKPSDSFDAGYAAGREALFVELGKAIAAIPETAFDDFTSSLTEDPGACEYALRYALAGGREAGGEDMSGKLEFRDICPVCQKKGGCTHMTLVVKGDVRKAVERLGGFLATRQRNLTTTVSDAEVEEQAHEDAEAHLAIIRKWVDAVWATIPLDGEIIQAQKVEIARLRSNQRALDEARAFVNAGFDSPEGQIIKDAFNTRIESVLSGKREGAPKEPAGGHRRPTCRWCPECGEVLGYPHKQGCSWDPFTGPMSVDHPPSDIEAAIEGLEESAQFLHVTARYGGDKDKAWEAHKRLKTHLSTVREWVEVSVNIVRAAREERPKLHTEIGRLTAECDRLLAEVERLKERYRAREESTDKALKWCFTTEAERDRLREEVAQAKDAYAFYYKKFYVASAALEEARATFEEIAESKATGLAQARARDAIRRADTALSGKGEGEVPADPVCTHCDDVICPMCRPPRCECKGSGEIECPQCLGKCYDYRGGPWCLECDGDGKVPCPKGCKAKETT